MPRILIFAAAVLIWTGIHARAADHPPVDCVQVRAYVAEHGKAAALAWAIGQGYSWKQIREARRICGV